MYDYSKIFLDLVKYGFVAYSSGTFSTKKFKDKDKIIYFAT